MNKLSPKAESLLTALASQPGVTQQHMDGLRDAIISSPALVDLFNDTLANSSGRKLQRAQALEATQQADHPLQAQQQEHSQQAAMQHH